MSWQAIAFPIRIHNHTLALTEDLKLYATSDVSLGGNIRLIVCDMALLPEPPTCNVLNTGIAVPSTDGHFNLRDILIEGDFIYSCYARWTGLRCYRFSKTTGTGQSYGSVNPAGHSDLNYHHMVKIKEDEWYMKARVGNGLQWALFKFKGSPSQITDPAQWERIGYIIDDTQISAGSCGDGAIPFSYCSYWFQVNERYLLFGCYTRCPSSATEIGNFSVFIFDTVKERLLAPDFSEVGFGGNSLNPATKITVTAGKPTTVYRGETQVNVFDLVRRKAYGYTFWSHGGSYTMGIMDINLNTRTAKFITRASGASPPLPHTNTLTADGKLVFTEPGTVRQYDPQTESISDVMTVPGLAQWHAQACLQTEDIHKHVETIIVTNTHIILPPNIADGFRIPKRVITTSPGAGQLRVQAQFQLAPAQIRVRLWRIPEYTVAREETLAGATSIDRTYSGLTAGRYRAEVTAL
jgi:hypothetical protein